ncbi:hypothetical protein FDW83_16425 [Pseudarthrobacter sp. NamE2]|uniref:hypothetical protein n=1 Tax=Pseudarthrobacter sp. NamE2 TaxID=2576838 RepID=UPI0010FD4D64|nr:hypothetical protein [Pseudarthrobacter sp. NamE2]TLM81389.1 hypothetical protein FDW83_16425 [Pseudarthrobacter sp. NamE2]
MGIGDSIGKAAENAMEDLAGTSKPTEKLNVPEPTDPNDDVEVHSSISEGSNAMEAEKEKAPGLKTGPAPGPVSENPFGGDVDETDNDRAEAGRGTGDAGLAGSATAPGGGEESTKGRVSGVSGGLPDSNPDELRADPTEGDQDPSTSTGRG